MKSQAERDVCTRLRMMGNTLHQIAQALAVCIRTVQRWLNGVSTADRPLNRDQRRKLTSDQERVVVDFFLQKNTSRLRDGVEFVADTFNIRVSMITLGRVLCRHRLSFKRSASVYHEVDTDRQQAFLAGLRRKANKSWIALDEAAFFLNHSSKYAWSERGRPAVVKSPSSRGKMHSLILAVSPEGVVGWRLIQGSVSSTRFHEFLRSLRGNTNVLLGNRSTHHASHVLRKRDLSTIQQVADAKQITLTYLPPCSPQPNPVELCFNFIRKQVNRNVSRTLDALQTSIQAAIWGLEPAVCRGMFAKCSIIG